MVKPIFLTKFDEVFFNYLKDALYSKYALIYDELAPHGYIEIIGVKFSMVDPIPTIAVINISLDGEVTLTFNSVDKEEKETITNIVKNGPRPFYEEYLISP